MRKSGNNAEETCSTSQQILCCDSSAAVSMIKRKRSTRKTRHIELKAFSVQVRTDEMLADCLTNVPKPNSIHLSRLGLEIEPVPAQF